MQGGARPKRDQGSYPLPSRTERESGWEGTPGLILREVQFRGLRQLEHGLKLNRLAVSVSTAHPGALEAGQAQNRENNPMQSRTAHEKGSGAATLAQ
jgi:hypothetical protein